MNEVLNKTWFKFGEKKELINTIIISVLALLIPLFLAKLLNLVFGADSTIVHNSQLIIGTIVNSLLIVSSLNISGYKKLIGIVTMPSLATICSGLLFKSASPAMIYMIPAIWLGNFSLIYLYKLLFIQKKHSYILSSIIAILTKVLIIYTIFNLLKLLSVFPNAAVNALSYSMGLLQLITASLGSILAYLVFKSYK